MTPSASGAPSRAYDVVLFGATGFAGTLTAERLAATGPPELRWAIAGRDRGRLDALAGRLRGLGPAGSSIGTVTTDVGDPASMRDLAESATVVASTAGPFLQYGEPLVAACAIAGTSYADITGEPEFVDRMWLSHHQAARDTGARLVHACGFDSVPHDLGAWYTVNALPPDVPLTVRGFVRAAGAISPGTYTTMVTAVSRTRQAARAAGERRRRESSATASRRVRSLPQRPVRSPDGRGWALPMPTLDPIVVRRSARALERYGPDFGYGHYADFPGAATAAGAAVAMGGLVAAAALPPGRDLLLRAGRRWTPPSPQRRERSWFRVTFVGEGGGRRVVTRVSGGDPGYDETATMLAESALCLAYDDLPRVAGQVTPVQAMGEPLLERLRRRGLRFEVLLDEASVRD